jgi:hypothetical protein
MLRKTLAKMNLALVVGVWAPTAHAAGVTFNLVRDPVAIDCAGCTLSGPGTYQVFATADNAPDNFGIASFQVGIRNVTSALQRAPRSVVDPEGDALPAGFTLLRSSNNQDVTAGGFDVHGSQDNVTPTPHLIRGFGKEASSFATNLPGQTFGAPSTQTTWGASLLLFEGTYTPGGALPMIDFFGPTVANVFSTATGIATVGAAITIPFPPPTPEIQPQVQNFLLDLRAPGVLVSQQLMAIYPGTPGTPPPGGLVWTNLTHAGPGKMMSEASDPVLTTSGQFTWAPAGWREGQHQFSATVTDSANKMSTGLALTVNLTIIPEPTALLSASLAAIGLVGFARRRGERG